MRVRHLQTHLQDQALINEGKLETLRGLRIGIDAVYWLRSIQALKDPFADALGGVPPGIFGFVDRELDYFRKNDITPFFIFQGIAPGPQHSMFINRMDSQMEAAWTYLARGQKSEAQKCFAVSTSRINGDFVYFIFHHLRQRGCEVLMAPYFAGSQLAHFAEQKVVHTCFGPPGLLLYNVQRVIIQIDFQHLGFEWVELKSVLEKWEINKEQFVDACMLAGTEYCLTYPFLNPGYAQGQQSSSTKFNFDQAITIIKQAPLINWMQTFPNEEMKNDHVEGYCTCKVLVQSAPILHTSSGAVQPLGGTGFSSGSNGSANSRNVPQDFKDIMGDKLPPSLYYLMVQGVISHKIPQAFARGEWVDKSQPLVDTLQFRDLLQDLNDYRAHSINLVVRHLPKSFAEKSIQCKAFWEQTSSRHGQHGQATQESARKIEPDQSFTGLNWRITADAVQAEMQRQKVDKVDLKFCLNWHQHEHEIDGELFKQIAVPTPRRKGDVSFTKDKESLSALVHFMLLEQLDIISNDGSPTVFGEALRNSPKHLMEPCLVAIELMKFGVLDGNPYSPATEDRPFPQSLQYPSKVVSPTGSIFLLTRVMSLVPMRLKCDMWNADVTFDLAAFHSMVRILKRSLRQLTEASLASILMKDKDQGLSQVKLLPPGFLCASPMSKDHLQTHALLPTFMLPRSCMGIVADFFLKFQGDPQLFNKEIATKFPCCSQPRVDLQQAILFWKDVTRMVYAMEASGLGCDDIAEEMRAASQFLETRQQQLNLFPEPSNLRGDEDESVRAAVRE
jgi:hypothetical protein